VSFWQYGYRALVVGWDPEACVDVRGWDGLEHLWADHDPSRRPFYRVLCDHEEELRAFGPHRAVGVRYVAEANLTPATKGHAAGAAAGAAPGSGSSEGSPAAAAAGTTWVSPVRSSLRASYFASLDPLAGACLPSAALRLCYPDNYATRAPAPAALLAASVAAASAPNAAAGATAGRVSRRSSADATAAAFAAEAAAMELVVARLEALDAALQGAVAALAFNYSNGGGQGGGGSNLARDCSVLLRTAKGEGFSRHAEAALRVAARAHHSDAVGGSGLASLFRRRFCTRSLALCVCLGLWLEEPTSTRRHPLPTPAFFCCSGTRFFSLFLLLTIQTRKT
jgi:hemimethylated DNA binding protein